MIDALTNPPLIEAFAKLISAVLWPIVVLTLVFTFKGELSSLVRRIKKGKLLGGEIELAEEINQLADATEKAQVEFGSAPVPAKDLETSEQGTKSNSDVDEIISISSKNPELGIIQLARKIEHEMKKRLAMSGHARSRQTPSFSDFVNYLDRNAGVSENLRKSIRLFWEVRNKVVHGSAETTPENLVRIIDIGLGVLSAIRAIPQERNVVLHAGADLFSDPEGKQPLVDGKGLILETTSPGGSHKSTRIFPTTHTNYKVGSTVSWEWNINRKWGQTYYRDPWTNEIKHAWGSSGEFIGRDIDEI